MATLLLVEDNEAIAEAVVGYLELSDHVVHAFSSSRGVLEAVRELKPALIVLDVMLPGESGFALAKQVRAESLAPFLFLTARESESDRILGFELGAEDYVVKPFSPRELVLRIEAILRRTAPPRESSANGRRVELASGHHRLILEPESHGVLRDGGHVDLTASEWRILCFLAERPGRVVSREQILTDGLDYLHDGSERTVDTHVKNIRAKVGEGWIETVRGFGYRCTGKEVT
ncbi:MAG: response regulator transcription factor [Spirochaetales bacterium]